VAIDRIRYEVAIVVVERQSPKACGRGNSGQNDVAAPVEKFPVIVGLNGERYAVSERNRQSSRTGDRRARIWVGIYRSGPWPSYPALNGQCTEGRTSAQCEVSHAQTDEGRDGEGEQCSC